VTLHGGVLSLNASTHFFLFLQRPLGKEHMGAQPRLNA